MDFLAGLLELTGLWIVGNKNKLGFLVNILCNFAWISYVLFNNVAYGLLIVVIPAVFVNLRNFIKWGKK